LKARNRFLSLSISVPDFYFIIALYLDFILRGKFAFLFLFYLLAAGNRRLTWAWMAFLRGAADPCPPPNYPVNKTKQ
jgi:hypothetical protein